MLKVHETTTESAQSGESGLASVFLRFEDGVLALVSDEGAFPLPDGALEAVMTRYGAPLETAEPLIAVDVLDLGDGRGLRHVRHLARYDVIARDYLVYEGRGREPLCALATTVAGALAHLGRAAAAAQG
jgi:hypothetical protein